MCLGILHFWHGFGSLDLLFPLWNERGVLMLSKNQDFDTGPKTLGIWQHISRLDTA